MSDLIRDAPIGQIVRYITRNKILLYPEEKPDFQYADYATKAEDKVDGDEPALNSSSSSVTGDHKVSLESAEPPYPPRSDPGLDALTEKPVETTHPDVERGMERSATGISHRSRVDALHSLSRARTGAELEATLSHASSLAKTRSQALAPQRTSDGTILVDWYTTDDPDNPQNWSQGKKAFASMSICLYTFAVYLGSSIYTPSETGVMRVFGVSTEAATLGLALYVLAYGLGPLLFSPLSEIPSIGRNPPYMATMAIYVILCVPAALVDNFAGLLVLRFLQGFFGSPCLATGGASLSDMYSFIKLPYVLCIWAFAATGGPSLGPLISGFSVTAENWRWSLWEMLWLGGPIFIVMMLFLPETSGPNILLRRARRLRKLTEDHRLRAQSEIDQANLNAREVAFEALVRPMQLIFLDPAIGFTAGYVALCYGIYYSFFEAFPLVYIEKYGFNVGEMGLTFLSITVGVLISIAGYYTWLYKIMEPDIRAHGFGAPEKRLVPALFASFLLPVGLFLFGWTGDGRVYWLVSVIGIVIFTMGVFVLMQCIFVYLPLVYPQYAASLFAGNDASRSLLAFAAVLFSRPMYLGLGIGPGCSLLAGLTAACIGGIFVLYYYGERLRAKSRFAAK